MIKIYTSGKSINDNKIDNNGRTVVALAEAGCSDFVLVKKQYVVL